MWEVFEDRWISFWKWVSIWRIVLLHSYLSKTLSAISTKTTVFRWQSLSSNDNCLFFFRFFFSFYLFRPSSLLFLSFFVLNDWRLLFLLINELFRLNLKNSLLVSHTILFKVLDLSWSAVLQGFHQSFSLWNIFFLHIFVDNRFVSVFDHVLSSCIIKERDNVSPMSSIFLDILKKNFIFLCTPLSFFDVVIEMILVALSALLRSFEVLASWVEIEVFSNLIPLSFFKMTI